MDDLIPFLLTILRRRHDVAWLREHQTELHTALTEVSRYLNFANTEPQDKRRLGRIAMRVWDVVLPIVALYEQDVWRWSQLLSDDVTRFFNTSGNNVLLLHYPAQVALMLGAALEAETGYQLLLEHAQDSHNQRAQLIAIIGKIRTYTNRLSLNFSPLLVSRALALAAVVNQPRLTAQLHQALAMVYNYQAETAQALAHGQMALVLWACLLGKHSLEYGQTCFVLGQCLRQLDNVPLALRYHEMTSAVYALYPPALRQSALDFEMGCIDYHQGQFAAARDAFRYVRADLTKMGQLDQVNLRNLARQHWRATLYQAIGMTNIYLRQYDDARDDLLTALELWRNIRNEYEEANTLHVLAIAVRWLNRPDDAVQYLAQAQQIAAWLPVCAAVERLRADIAHKLADVNDKTRF
jgi:tetratricopeptide (TPR) repeat protein